MKTGHSFRMTAGAAFLLAAMAAVSAAAAPQLPARAPRQGGVYVIAHRGAHNGIPENTIPAYAKAIELGADFVEVDLRPTKDGHIVSVHNSTVDAYTQDAKGNVSDFTLDELKAMDIGSRVGLGWADTRIPTLEEIIALCRGKIGLYVDLKAADVEAVVAQLRAAGMAGDAVWYAGAGQLRKLRETCPECQPMPDPGHEKGLPRLLDMLQPKVVASSMKNLTPAMVKACHDAGALLFVDDTGPGDWAQMLAWGVDGIQTDEPEALIALLKARDAQK
ncbi:MAG: glycerophosphodiester phosphodiesterase family protein [Candidatus Hydrogenedens sp.]|nr:glycerophosphodiester phosphodiesterase family protein [Candidatus Hydrogenedentota bacterium]NLF56686.1 glycerophosphodiester phosphodiesterase family protein [Candidatus Hydrogenedens sp.]